MITTGLYYFMRDDVPIMFPYNGVLGVLITENDGLAKTLGRLLTKSDPRPIQVYRYNESADKFIETLISIGAKAFHVITTIDDNDTFKATSFILDEKPDASVPLPE
jgi:hypothetical protein